MHFGVLGSGIIGLTTALELQKEFPTARVSVIADRFNEDTVSYVAAGIFRPGTSFMGPTQKITQWESVWDSNTPVVHLTTFLFIVDNGWPMPSTTGMSCVAPRRLLWRACANYPAIFTPAPPPPSYGYVAGQSTISDSYLHRLNSINFVVGCLRTTLLRNYCPSTEEPPRRNWGYATAAGSTDPSSPHA